MASTIDVTVKPIPHFCCLVPGGFTDSDSHIYSSWSYKSFVETVNVVCCEKCDAFFSCRNTVKSIQETRESDSGPSITIGVYLSSIDKSCIGIFKQKKSSLR